MSVTPIDGQANSKFGGSVALSANGKTLVIGGMYDDVGQQVDQGSARVFDWNGTGWQQRSVAITPTDGVSYDAFGSSVAISADGNIICIGGNADDAGLGSARVFVWDGGAWVQRGGLLRPADASQYERWDRVSISSDGLNVIVSTPYDDVGANTWQGSAVIFHWDGAAWVQRGDRITRPSSIVDNEDEFWGYSNAINADGSTIIIGVHSDSVDTLQGSARVLDWDGTQWVQRGAPLAPADGELGDGFGASVDLSANGLTAIVGGERDNVGANQDQGSARVFDWSGTAWVQRGGALTASDGGANNYFGNSVSLSADGLTAIVGGPRYDVSGTTDQGGAVVFHWTGVEWAQRGGVLTPADGAAYDLFGFSVDLSSDGLTAIVGGPDDDVSGTVDQGSARVFAWNGVAWVEGGPAISSTISIAAASASKAEGNSGTTAYTFTATRTGDTSTAQSAAWAVTGSGTDAADAIDFVGGTLPTGTVTFGIGETSKTITVAVAGDTSVENDEGFTVSLSNPSENLAVGAGSGDMQFYLRITVLTDGRDILKIADNTLQWEHYDFAAPGRHISVGDLGGEQPTKIEISQDGNNWSSPVNWFPEWSQPYPNEIRFEADSSLVTYYDASSFNLIDLDIVSTSARGTISLVQEPAASNDFEALIEFNDNPPSGPSWYSAVFSVVFSLDASTASGTIINDDASVSIAAASASKAERNSGTTAYTFTATRTGDTSTEQTANWAVTGSSANAATASDFQGGVLPTGTVTFGIGQTSKTITVNVLGETSVEADEGFTITLSTPSSGLVFGAAAASGTIMNDDGLPPITPTYEKLFVFSANNTEFGTELWITNATSEGTFLVKDIRPGLFEGGQFYEFAHVGDGRVIFSVAGGQFGPEIWVTDGTEAGTYRAAPDIFYGGEPLGFMPLGDGRVLFHANDGIHGQELWITDGTEAGTSLILDILPGVGNGNPQSIAANGDGTAVFSAYDAALGYTVWSTDGTALGTHLILDPMSGAIGEAPRNFFGLGQGRYVFVAFDGSELWELWSTDGSAAGTFRIVEELGGVGEGHATGFINVGDGRLLFGGGTFADGAEPWVTDGTSTGTYQIKDISPGISSSAPRNFTPMGDGRFLFSAETVSDGHGIWITDLTEAGTMLVADPVPGEVGNPSVGFTALGDGRAVFWNRGHGFQGGTELWVTDGTSAGTSKVLTFSSSFFFFDYNALSITSLGDGRAIFSSPDDGVYGRELWVTDGTPEGTSLVTDINGGVASSTPYGFISLGAVNSSLSVAAASAGKAEGNAGSTSYTFTAIRTGDTSTAQTATWAVTGSGANAATGADFVGAVLPAGTVSFGIGVTSQTITVYVQGDTAVEDDEGFTVTLSAPSAGLAIGTATATGTIINDDASVSIAVTSASKAEGNSGTTAYTFTATRTGDTSVAHTVQWAVTGNGANATDFQGGVLPGDTLTFEIGQASKTITVYVQGDVAVEADEGFTVTLSAPSTGLVIGTATASGTIINDDASVSIAAASASKAEGNSGATAYTFTATRTGDTSTAQTAVWAVTGSGTNTANATDFVGGTLPSDTVTFDIGQTTKNITVNVAGDTSVENHEGFTVTLSTPSTGLVLGTSTASGTIINDDASVSIVAASANKAEGNSGTTAYTFTATRTGDTSTAQTANWSVTGTGANAAIAADFQGGVLPSDTVTFDIGQTSKTITVFVQGDTSVENDEGFTVTLSAPSTGLVIGTATASGTIINDDASVSIVAASASKAEGNSGTTAYTFTATRTGDTTTAHTASWAVTGSGTNGATASDFVGGVLPSDTVSFGIGVTSQTITVNVLGDTSVETDEGFTVTLSNPSTGLLIGTATASGTIQNDDSSTPASPSVSGVVYHWKSHALLSGVTVSAENSSSGSSSTALEFRDVRTDASGNVLVDLWGNGASGVGNFGADLSLGTGITAAFQSSLPGDWTVLQNSGAGSLSLAGFGLTSVSGSTKLGTLTFTKSGSATPFSVSLQSGEYGTLTATSLSLGYVSDVTGADGVFQIDVGAGTYTLDASRSVSDVGRAVSSADALAALKLAVSLNPNSDPDGMGPLQPARVSPYQFLAADVNNSGTITSADALSILKMAVRLVDAPQAEWLFLREQDTFWNAGSSSYSVTRSAVPNAELPVSLQIGGAVTQNLVGVLTGDVNGSWRPVDANGNALAEGAYPVLPDSYFVALSSTLGAPLDLWGS